MLSVRITFSPPAQVSQVVNLKSVAWVILHLIYSDLYLMPLDGLVSEGEFLDITEIKRQQADDYECITNNGVAPPDQRKVKVTVNCKYSSLRHRQWWNFKSHWPSRVIVHDVLMIYVNTALLCILLLYSQVVFQLWGQNPGWLDLTSQWWQLNTNCWILSFCFSARPSHDYRYEEHASPFG